MELIEKLKIGVGKFKNSDLYGAERVFREIIDTHAEHPDAYHNLGVILVKTDRMEQSVFYFEKALSIDGEKAQYWISYADVLISLKNIDKFNGALKKLMQLNNSEEVLAPLRLRVKEEVLIDPPRQTSSNYLGFFKKEI